MNLDLMMIDYGCGGFKRYAVSIVRELKRRAPQITIGAFYMSCLLYTSDAADDNVRV